MSEQRTKQPSTLPYRKEKLGPRTRLQCKGSSSFLQTQIRKMAHGGYEKRRVSEHKPEGRPLKGLAVDKKPKLVPLKNQIRSTEHFLRKNLSPEIKEFSNPKRCNI